MTSTREPWQVQNEIWQAAVKERGDKAYQLFEDTPAIKNSFGRPKMDNGAIEVALKYDEGIELKPITELIEIDIRRYGDNAFLMYRVDINGVFEDIAANHCINTSNHLYERKLYANAPFNIEWAKAGVAVQFRYDLRWFDCAFKQMMSERIAVLTSTERPSDLVAVDKIRHPFPPNLHRKIK